MSLGEFKEWQIADQVRPFGTRLQILLVGIQCAAMYNLKRTKDSDRIWEPKDFVGHLMRKDAADTATELNEEQKAKAMHAMAIVHNARERRRLEQQQQRKKRRKKTDSA